MQRWRPSSAGTAPQMPVAFCDRPTSCPTARLLDSLPEITAQQRSVVVREDADQLAREVVGSRRSGAAIALIVRRAALVNIVFEPIVQIAFLPPLLHLGFVVELDLIHQQLGEPLGFLVDLV